MLKLKPLYISFISAIGLAVFWSTFNIHVGATSNWVVIYALTGSIMLLDYFDFKLPPEGNRQSLDSAVYLTTIFTYGIQFALWAAVLNFVIMFMIRRKRSWWTHLFNFANYVLMISSASELYSIFGGRTGDFNEKSLLSYLVAMTSYFLVNTIIVGGYFYIVNKGNLYQIVKEIIKDTFIAYSSTLLLSLVLSILITKHSFFGLSLFTIICVLLSIGFQELFKLYSEVAQKAIKDQRTGLFNHGYFEELLDRELARAKHQNSTFSLALLDLDNFKRFNDTFGHLKGDKLLEFVAKLLQKECSPHSYIVARYGGEEFTVILPNTDEMQAFQFINQVRKRLNDTEYEGVDVFPHGCVSFSAGVAEYRKSITDKSQLIDKADQGLYYAKAQGKNLVHIYNEQSIIQKTIDIEQDIREIEQQLNIFLAKDIYTFQHSKRVFGYAVDFCDYVQLQDHEKKEFVLGALIHDIGKLEVPKEILKKKSKLTAEEWQTVKRHVEWGKDIVSAMDKYKQLAPLVELHHERFDGGGYPRGLQGEEIPKLARMLCIVDSFDAMTTERPYQRTKTFDEAICELQRCSGEQFDPYLAEAFITMIREKYAFRIEAAAASDQFI